MLRCAGRRNWRGGVVRLGSTTMRDETEALGGVGIERFLPKKYPVPWYVGFIRKI